MPRARGHLSVTVSDGMAIRRGVRLSVSVLRGSMRARGLSWRIGDAREAARRQQPASCEHDQYESSDSHASSYRPGSRLTQRTRSPSAARSGFLRRPCHSVCSPRSAENRISPRGSPQAQREWDSHTRGHRDLLSRSSPTLAMADPHGLMRRGEALRRGGSGWRIPRRPDAVDELHRASDSLH